MKLEFLASKKSLDYRLKSEKTDNFKWYSVYENNEHVGHVSFLYTNDLNVKVESLFITNKNKGYGTKILREICSHANELSADKVIIADLMTGAYGLSLLDRLKIFKKIGNAFKSEGLVKKVIFEDYFSTKNVIYLL